MGAAARRFFFLRQPFLQPRDFLFLWKPLFIIQGTGIAFYSGRATNKPYTNRS